MHFCHKEGHIARYCRVKQARNNDNNGDSCHLVDSSSDRDRAFSMLSTSSVLTSSSDCGANNVFNGKVDFYLDSTTTNHIVNNKMLFSSFIEFNEPELVTIARKDVKLSVTGVGNVSLSTESGTNIIFKNVRYSSDIPVNLISVRRMAKSGFSTAFHKDHADVIISETFNDNNPRVIFRAKCVMADLYSVKFKCNVNGNLKNSNEAFVLTNDVSESEIWHQRLAHLNYGDLSLMKSNGLLPIKETVKSRFCESCVFGKQARKPFKTNEAVTRFPLELVHSDLCMITTTSYDNYRYFITFLDDYTHFCYVYFLYNKSEALSKFKDYCSLASNRFNRNVMRLRCDRGTEYLNDGFRNFCNQNGIHLEPTMAYSPQQNGKAERLNRTLVERGRTILRKSKLDKSFWTEALACAAYVINRCPTSKGFIPHNRWYGKDFEYNRLKVFGCDAYRFTYKHSGDKFVDKSEKLVFVGYAPGATDCLT